MEPVNKYLLVLVLPDPDIELAQNRVPRLVLAHKIVETHPEFPDADRAEGPEVFEADEPVPLRIVLDPLSKDIVELVLFARGLIR